jgi:hypothetical protein
MKASPPSVLQSTSKTIKKIQFKEIKLKKPKEVFAKLFNCEFHETLIEYRKMFLYKLLNSHRHAVATANGKRKKLSFHYLSLICRNSQISHSADFLKCMKNSFSSVNSKKVKSHGIGRD